MKHLIKTMAFTLLGLVLSSNVWAETAYKTLTFPDDNSANNKKSVYTDTWKAKMGTDEWSIVNFNNNSWNNDWTYIKCGRKNNASVAAIISPQMSVKIETVTITLDAVNDNKTNSIKLYTSTNGSSWTEVGTYTEATGAQKVDIASANQATNLYYKVEFDCASHNANGFNQVSKVEYFEAQETPVGTVAAPTFNPATGAEFYPTLDVELKQKDGEDIYYCLNTSYTDKEELFYASTKYTGAIPLIESATIQAIAVDDNDVISEIANATYTKTTPLSTMDAIFEASATAGDYYITFNNWVISGVKGNNAYLTDNNGKGLILYKKDHGFEVGDILSGTIECALTRYNGSAEITNLTSSSTGLTVTKGGSVTAAEKNISDLSGVNTGALVSLGTLTYNGSNVFSDGTNTITAYNGIMTNLPTWTSGLKYTVQGIYIQFDTQSSTTQEIAPRDASDIVEKSADKFNITIADGIQNGSVSVQGGKTQAAEGEEVVLTIAPADNFKLATLIVNDENVTTSVVDNKYTFSMPAKDVTIFATFDEKSKYTITWKVKGQADATTTVTEGETLSLPVDPEFSGYKFIGWTASAIDGKQSTSPTLLANNTTPTESKTYYAVFAVVTGQDPVEGSYTLNYANEGLADKSGWGTYSETYYTHTASDGSQWEINAYKSSGIQINNGKTGIAHIKVPSCPGYITTISITANSNAKKATKFSATLDESAAALATATENTSQTLDLTGKNVTDGYILATGNVQITNVVVNYSGTKDHLDNYTTNPTAQVKVKFDLNGGTGTFNDASIDEGSNYTVTTDEPTPATGYEFVDWINGDNHYVGGNTIENVTSDITLTAQYKKAWYAVGKAAMENGDITITSLTEGKAEYGATVTLTPVPATNYTLESISAYKAGESTTEVTLTPDGENYTFTMPAYAVEISATFITAASSCDINFYVAGNLMTTISKKRGEAYEITEVGSDVDGFTFVGWATQEYATEQEDVIATISSITPPTDSEEAINLYAVYKRAAVEAAYEKVTAAPVAPATWEGDYLIAYSDEVFANGKTGGTDGIGKQNTSVNPKSALDNGVVAKEWGDEYKVSIEACTNGYLLKTQDGLYNYQTSDANGITTSNKADDATDDPITITLNEGGTVHMGLANGAKFQYNTSGYFRFYKSTSSMKELTLYKLGEASYVYTTSPIVKYTISYDLNGGTAGEGNFDEQQVVKGETATLTTSVPVAPTGYEFDGWYNGDVKVGATIENVQNDIELVAHYNILSYLVTIPTVDNGTIVVAPLVEDNAAYNTELTITLTPATDFEVVPNSLKVYETDNESNVVTVSDDNKFNMPAFPVTVVAAFQGVTPNYTITVQSSDNAKGTVSIVGETETILSLKEGDERTILAYPEGGYRFVNWTTEDDKITITNADKDEATFTVKASDATITANFEAIPSVTYTKITTTEDLAYNDKVIIVAATADKAMSSIQGNNNRGEVAITRGNEGATITLATDEVAVLDVVSGNAAQTFAFHDANGYLYAASSSSNHMKSEDELDANGNGNWSVAIDDGSATIIARGTNTRNLMLYNKNSSLFSCYQTTTSLGTTYQYVSLYRIKSDEQVLVTLMNGEDVFARYRANKNSTITLNGFIPTVEGKTVVGWTDGETVYAADAEVTVAEANLTLNIAFGPDFVRTDLSNGQLITVCWENEIASVEGGTFYEILNGNISEITFQEVALPIAAGTPVIFESDGTDMKVNYGEGTYEGALNESIENGAFVGLVRNAEIDNVEIEQGNILINNGQLRQVGEYCVLTKGHAYIKTSALSSVNNAPRMGARTIRLYNPDAQAPTNLNGLNGNMKATKVLRDGQLYIIRDTKTYNAQGIEVQ